MRAIIEFLNLIIEFCKAEGIILTIVDNYDLLIDRRLHGIRFTSDYEKIELLRTQAGAHPIVGVNISDISDLKQLRYLDIDYLVINVPKIGADDSCLLVKGIKKQWNIRVVGEIDTIDSATQNKLLEAGFDGFCLKL